MKLILSVIQLLSCLCIFAQTQTASDPETSETDNYEISDWLEQASKNPISINTANLSELCRLPGITPAKATGIIKHRKEYGPFKTLYELQVVKELDLNTVLTIKDFICTDLPPFKNLRENIRQNGIQKSYCLQINPLLNKTEGYKTLDSLEKFEGSAIDSRHFFKISTSDAFEFNLCYGKNAGEKVSNGFISFSLQLSSHTKIRKLILGNFNCNASQGLLFGAGMASGKSAQLMNMVRISEQIKTTQSLNESGYFQGLASEIQLSPQIKIHALAAFKPSRSDTIHDTEGVHYIQSGYSGLRRNKTELRKIPDKSRLCTGAFFSAKKQSTTITVAMKEEWRQQQGFTRLEESLLSVGIKSGFKNLFLFSETSCDISKHSLNGVHGLVASIGKHSDLTSVFRHYSCTMNNKDLVSFSESSSPAGETGLYIGLNTGLGNFWHLSAFSDHYSFSQAVYNVDAPSDGKEIQAILSKEKRKAPGISLRIRYKSISKNESGTQTLNQIDQLTEISKRLDLSCPLSRSTSYKMRLEIKSIHSLFIEKRHGWMIYHDFKTSVNNHEINLRLMFFNTDDYDTRIFVFERNLSHAYSVLSYNNTGMRFYLFVKRKINEFATGAIRFAVLKYFDRNEMGSGPDLLKSSHKEEIKLEINFKL